VVRSLSERDSRRTLKARWLFPVAGDPIADGAVTIEAGRIVAVGKPQPGAAVEDLGNVAILPGLVNAHVHLELSDVAKPLGKRGMNLVEWIREVIAHRRQRGAASADAVRRGIEEGVRYGTTTVGEIAQPDWRLEPFVDVGIQAVVFLELIAPTPERARAAMDWGVRHLDSAGRSQAFTPGLGPHAPYSVHPRLLRLVVELSRERRVAVAFHLAESCDELEYLQSGTGPLVNLLRELGAWDAASSRQPLQPIDYLQELALADRALVIHGNYLDDEEIAFLARHADRMSLVYCPRTHDYFPHDAYPLEKALSAGVTVALGTDSRASAPDLSVLAEMRFVANRYPSVPPRTVLRMGTLDGARALGLDAEVGSLEPGKRADLAIVALGDRDAADPHELLLDPDLSVVATIVAGDGERMKDEG
jgi:cytosine/adenosine deaminase-related metal-dependent hydrolase